MGKLLHIPSVEGEFVIEREWALYPMILDVKQLLAARQLRVTVPDLVIKDITEGVTTEKIKIVIYVARYHWEGDESVEQSLLNKGRYKIGNS